MSCALVSHMHTHLHTLTRTHIHTQVQTCNLLRIEIHHTDFKYTVNHIIQTHIKPIIIILIVTVTVITCDTSKSGWFQYVID